MTGRPSWAAGPRSFGPPPSRRGPGGATWRAVREAIDLLNQLAAIADVAEQGDAGAGEDHGRGEARAALCGPISELPTHRPQQSRAPRPRPARIEDGAAAPFRPESPAVALEREQPTAYREYRLGGGLVLDMPKLDAQAEPAAPSRPANDPAGGELDVVRSDIPRLLASGKGDLPRLTEHEGKHAKAARSRSTSWPRSSRQERCALSSATKGGGVQNVLLHRLGRARELGLSGPEMLSRCCPVNAALLRSIIYYLRPRSHLDHPPLITNHPTLITISDALVRC